MEAELFRVTRIQMSITGLPLHGGTVKGVLPKEKWKTRPWPKEMEAELFRVTRIQTSITDLPLPGETVRDVLPR